MNIPNYTHCPTCNSVLGTPPYTDEEKMRTCMQEDCHSITYYPPYKTLAGEVVFRFDKLRLIISQNNTWSIWVSPAITLDNGLSGDNADEIFDLSGPVNQIEETVRTILLYS